MKVINLIFTRILAEKSKDFKPSGAFININFLNVEKDNTTTLKDFDVFKVDFDHVISYKKTNDKKALNDAQVLFEGKLILSLTKDESKDILKSWKNKEIPANIKKILFNVILKKCSIKALSIEEEINLPPHLPLPNLNKTN